MTAVPEHTSPGDTGLPSRLPPKSRRLRRSGTPAPMRVLVAFVGVVATFAGSMAPAGAAPVISGGSASYTEQEPPVNVGVDLEVNGGTSYDGQYIEFEVGSSGASETLALEADASASTASGVVSVVGSTVYLGDGSTAQPIGVVDPTYDGTSGKKLRVDFTSPFVNPGFEDGGTTGWNIMNQRIDLGVTAIAGHTSVDTATYPTSPTNDDTAPAWASWNVGVTTNGSPTEGAHALELQSSMTTTNTCDIVHGPAVYSNSFQAATGDSIYFDWRAFAGDDAYHVFGYVLDEHGHQTEVLDAYTTDTSGSTNWATKETVIPADGTYRFVFVAGTYDASCGKAAGARLLIDNLRVYGNKVSDTVATAVAKKLTYHNSSDDPSTPRTITVTAQSASNGTGSGTLTLDVTAVDDAPTLDQPAGATFTNTIADDTFTDITGTLTASDPDSTSLTFDVVGATGTDARTVTGTYSTVTLDPTTGAYTVTADDPAIEAQMTATSDTYTVTVTADGQTAQQTLTVAVAIETSPPGAPTITGVVSGDSEISVTWEPHAWLGGSAISDYRIDHSSDDGASWTTFADGTSTETYTTVTSLTPGTSYRFRIAATNASGTGDWSTPSDAVVAKTHQDTLTVVAADFTYGDSTELSTDGGSGTGTVTYAVISGPCTITDATLSASAVGACVISATKAPDTTYFEATTATFDVHVAPKTLQVRDAEVIARAYNGTTSATIEGAALHGVVGTDEVSLSGHTTGSFSQAEPGTAIRVATSMTLTGTAAGNYILPQPQLTGVIEAKALTVSGAAVVPKVYDGTADVTISGAALGGVVAGDDVSLAGHEAASLTQKQPGRRIPVVTTMTLTGHDATNYTLVQPKLFGAVEAKQLTVSGATVASKVYDGTTDASITGAVLTGVVHGDEVSVQGDTKGAFADATARLGVTVTTSMSLAGADAGSYTLIQPQLSGDILAAPRIVDGVELTASIGTGDALSTILCHLRPDSAVTARIGDTVVGKATADAEGCASVTFAVPSWLAAGTHEVLFDVTDANGTPAQLARDVEVLGAQVTAEGAGSGALPATGSSVTTAVLAAAAALVAGAALRIQPWNRRKRHA